MQIQEILTEKCWKGYTKKGMKTHFGKRVPNCVKNEDFEVLEGPNDPAIFKAVFTAGGPGSGKSFAVRNSGFSAMGFKVINSDIAFEKMLKQMNMTADPETIYSPQGQEVRDKAKDCLLYTSDAADE